MFAFEMFLDEATELYVKACWKAISEAGISNYMNGIENMRPHITLAVCNKIQLDSLISLMDDALSNQLQFEYPIDILASFPTSGTLFLSPTITEKLLMFHQDLHDRINPYTEDQNIYYKPEHWNPHITLATGLKKTELIQAYELVARDFKTFNTRSTEVSLVKLIFQDGICVKNEHIKVIKL